MFWKTIGVATALAATSAVGAQCVECAQQTTNAYLQSQTTRNSLDASRKPGRLARPPPGQGKFGVSQWMLDKYPGLKLHQERRGGKMVTVACGVDRGGTGRCKEIG
jgi:hypothetical protein